MEETVEVVETVTEDTTVPEETKSPTQYRVERERKQERLAILKELGIESLEDGKSLIEEHSELVAEKETLTKVVTDLTTAKDEVEKELSILKQSSINDEKSNEIIKRLKEKNAINAEFMVKAIDLNAIGDDGNYDEIANALYESFPDMFSKTVIAGDQHINSDSPLAVDPLAKAISEKDYRTANKLTIENILKK